MNLTGLSAAMRWSAGFAVFPKTAILHLRTKRGGPAQATVVEIDRGTCPAMAGSPSGRKSLQRRDIQWMRSSKSPITARTITAPRLKAPL